MSSKSFFEQNRTAIFAGVAALALAGSVFYFNQPSTSGQSPADSPKSASKKKKSKKKAAKKGNTNTLYGFNLVQIDNGPQYPVIDDSNKLNALEEQQRAELGEMLKVAGNQAFNAKQTQKALELYSSAIECNAKNPVFYSNRAAVYGALQENENVIADASKALELQPDYLKCFSRRGVAYENIGNYAESVMDFTAACILSRFEDESFGKAVDRVLKLQAEKIISEKFQTKTSDWPSPTFVTAYMQSFHKRALPEAVQNAQDGGELDLKLAFDAMEKENLESYKQSVQLISSALEKGLATKEVEALALEYQATFKFLLNDVENALDDMNRAIEMFPTPQAMIKRSSLHVELGRLQDADSDFKQAEKLDATCPDIHYQLAQLAFLQQQWPTAVESYERAISIDDTFLLAYIQLAVTKYRMGQTDVAKSLFQKLIEKYPDSSNAHNYYGEVLLDLGDAAGATKEFDIAIDLELKKSVAAINVLPLVNKALSLQSGKPEDLEKGVKLCEKSVTLDPASDVAIGTLAQFCLQQGKVKEAIEYFERNARLARTKPEQVQAMTFAEAARTQYRIGTERPFLRERLELLSRAQQ